MEVLRASSKAYLLPSQRDSKQSSLSAASKKVIQASAPGIKGFSAASETFPAPPTAFPQRQIVSHLAVSKTYQQPVVAVVYFQVTPAQTNDGSILSVECSENTTNSKFLGLNCESVVALWSLKNPSSSISPGAVLMCHSSLICCDLQAVDRSHSETPQQPSHSAATAGFIVVGGCTDGSVCVWDTRSHPHMHCAWQDPADSAAKGSTDKGDRALQQTAVYAPVFSTICPDDSTAGTSPSTVKDQQANSFEFEGFERLEEISQVAIVAEGRSTANSGRSEKYTEASGNFSVLVLTATGVVSLWAVVVSRGVTRTAAGAFLLDRHGAGQSTSLVSNRHENGTLGIICTVEYFPWTHSYCLLLPTGNLKTRQEQANRHSYRSSGCFPTLEENCGSQACIALSQLCEQYLNSALLLFRCISAISEPAQGASARHTPGEHGA